MCSRFRQLKNLSPLRGFLVASSLPNFPFNPNVAPTEESPIIRLDDEGNSALTMARFGLIPSWAKDLSIAAKLINARAETIDEKPAFADAYQKRRCLIPVAGFYEWRGEGDIKQPFYFHLNNDQPVMFAGLWEKWEREQESIYLFSIITTEPNTQVREYHNRMPVILTEESWIGWLQEGGKELLVPANIELNISRMNPAMNNPRVKSLAEIENLPAQGALF